MKRVSPQGTIKAFTVIEVIVVIGLLALMWVLLLPAGNLRSPALKCLVNLKQETVGLLNWQADHDGKFPWQVSTTNGGTAELVPLARAFPHFQITSNYVRQLGILICPFDKTRKMAANYAELSDQNVSYFIDLDATTNNRISLLSGDRLFKAGDSPVQPGTFIWTTNLMMSWTRESHKGSASGNLAFSDCHVERSVGTNLATAFQRQTVASCRIVVP